MLGRAGEGGGGKEGTGQEVTQLKVKVTLTVAQD